MIIELRSLLPAREEEESPCSPGKTGPGETPEVNERSPVEMEFRSAELPRTSPIPESVPFPEPSPISGFFPAAGSDAAGDDRILELLGRLVDTAERSAALSERIADLMERQSSVSGPVYA